MAKLHAFSVYDSKAKAFINPFFLPERALAARAFSDCVNDPKHAFCRNSADYTLFYVGEFDPLSGALEAPREGIEAMHNGVELVRRVVPESQLSLPEVGGSSHEVAKS